MWELDHKEGWTPKNWCFRTVLLEKTLESPADSKEIRPVNLTGNQLWIFTEGTDAETEGPILWPLDEKSRFTGKDPDAGKDWGQKEKGATEDEIVGWYHYVNGHEFKQTLGDGEGQGSLACCSPWGCKDTTERLSNSNNLCFYISTYLLTHQNILSTSQKRFNLEIRVLALSWLVAIDIIVVKPDWLADLVD